MSFVLTNLGWILFKKDKTEPVEKDHLDHPCQKILILEQDFKNHKDVVKNRIDLNERRLNAHAKDLDVLRETIVRQEQNNNHLNEKVDEIKAEISKITDFLYSGKWKSVKS